MPPADQTQTQPKKSAWCFWTCGVIFVLIVAAVAALFVFKNISKSSQSKSTKGIPPYSPMSQGELVNYLAEEVTTYGDKTVKLQRWTKDILVQIKGNADAESLALIDRFIEKFNKNSNAVKMKKVTTGGNFTIEFNAQPGNGLPGRAAFVSGNDCAIKGAVVEVGQEAGMLDSLPDYTINHELFHSLGFGGHYRSEESCTLMSAKHCADSYTPNEEKLIQMLYNSQVPLCSDETQIKEFFDKLP